MTLTKANPNVMNGVNWTFDTVADMVASTELVAGVRAITLGYYVVGDAGFNTYNIKSSGFASNTPDDGGRLITLGSGLRAQGKFDGLSLIKAEQFGVQAGVESSDAWNTAFWFAASIAKDKASDPEPAIRFTCVTDVLTNKTLHASSEPADEYTSGKSPEVEVYHPGRITAVIGGTLETHLNAEMARLTVLEGSTVALGNALAQKFLKADPQIAEKLGDKVERPLPILNISLQRVNVQFGFIDCNFLCSGVRVDGSTALQMKEGAHVNGFRKYGTLYTARSNNAIKTWQWNNKQWSVGDVTDGFGRMMAGGISEAQNMTGDPMAVCQKDMMWFGCTTGWGRTAITLLDKLTTVEADRWCGRTMYPDRMTKWNDSIWDDYGGAINNDSYNYMAPSSGTGDCDFYGLHVMQDLSVPGQLFRLDGLDFGGQTGIECWNTSNPANFYGTDIDGSITQIFGTSIRFFGPTQTVGSTDKQACFHPVMRVYAYSRNNARLTRIEGWTRSIGFFDFDRGVVGAPDVVSLNGNMDAWNYRNRVDSGLVTGPVQYRGIISGGSGNLPSGSVTTIGDYFHVQEAGTYGGQAMALGDILYAVTLSPGTSYGANWHLGANDNVEALIASNQVTITPATSHFIPQNNNEPSVTYVRPAGTSGVRHEIQNDWWDVSFDGTTVTETGNKAAFKRSIVGDIELSGSILDSVGIGELKIDDNSGQPELRVVNSTTNAPANPNTVIVRKTGDTRYVLASVILSGTGTPEAAVTAIVSTIYLRTDGGAGTTMYVKESGTGNTGWVAK